MIDNGLDAVKVLPELAQLEMVRAAALMAQDRADGVVRMTDVMWFEPLVVAAGAEVQVDVQHGEWTVYVDTDDDAGSHGTVHVLDDATPDRVALSSGLVELGGTPEGSDAVLLGRHVTACLAPVCGQAGWDSRGVRLLRAAEVVFAGRIRDAAWGVVECSVDAARNVATADVDLLDRDGVRLVRLRGLEVSGVVATAPVSVAGPGRRVEWAGWSVENCVVAELSDVVSRVLGVPAERVDVAVELREFGFDSISLVEFAGVLGELWGVELTPDVFFSFPSLAELSGHLLGEHGSLMAGFYAEPVAGRMPVARVGGVRRRAPRRARPAEVDAGGMAVIGMSGRFPGARSVDELWQVLRDGRCVVGDGPAERGGSWATPAAVGPANRAVGVLPGVTEFDPLFFEISPLEAELMDPRQRLLLQEMWSALEDAGLGRGRLADERVGVFVGVEEGDYRTLVGRDASVTSNSNSILAARLSYFLNLTGPSMAINTSCSSGLVALHKACLSLRYGDCDIAVVAGANVLADARSHDSMAAAGMLSENGVCAAFDRNANGMVPGEAVVVVVLRRLADAERAGDRIYASVVGSGVNYDGRTNGITAPSGAAQARLLRDVYERVGISPESVGSLVAHGTGTRLGDPVEVNALAEAFKSEQRGFCALTSTKPNIGHTQAASGLASLVSLVLSMWHEEIPPTINCAEPSDYIRWDESPFFVNRELRPWPADGLRRGGVSAFGFSGTNAHVVLEARGTAREERAASSPALPAYILLVSGKNAGALSRGLTQLADHLESDVDLASASHTLMAGRHHHAHRCALVVHDRADAVRLLREAAEGNTPPKVYRGVPTREFTPNPLIEDLLDQALRHHHDVDRYQHLLAALADLYCQGYEPAFQGLFATTPALLSLPTYPFERNTYWVSAAPVSSTARLHPLVHENTSDLHEQRFTSVFTGTESFLADHVIRGTRTLPAAAYLEIARAAVERSIGTTVRLTNVRWVRPLTVTDSPVEVRIAVTPDALGFEITTEDVVHCQGTAVLDDPADAPVVDVAALRDASTRSIDGADCYAEFTAVQMHYGPSHRVLAELMLADTDTDVIVARLSPPGAGEYVLHPGLVDGVFQVPAAFRFAGYAAGAWRTPFALDEARIFAGAGEPVWAVVRRVSATATASRFDIDVCDEDGRVCFRFTGFTTSASSTHAEAPVTAVLAKHWTATPVVGGDPVWTERHVVFCDVDEVPAFATHVLRSAGDDDAARYHSLAGQLFLHVKEILEGNPRQDILLQVVVPGPLHAGLAGLLRTAHLENPKLTAQLIELAGPVAHIDAEASAYAVAPEVRYVDGKRLLPVWQSLAEKPTGTPWRAGGTYLITGGTGGLGLLFAREIAEREPTASIVLTGRSPRNERIDALLSDRVEYVQVDITDRAATANAVAALRENGHTLRGVLHCAGVLRDAHVVRKSVEEFQEVLSPKVTGLSNLDLATAQDDLDFLVCFASTSGVLGNAGQADYAAGNAFMDRFAAHRNEQVRAGLRHGRTLSVGWGLWQDGGMSMDEQSVARMTARHGLVPIPTEDGIAAFYRSLAADADQTVCLTVAEERHLHTMADRLAAAAPAKPRVRRATTTADLTGYLVDTMTAVMKLPADAVDVEEPLERYGIDSISVIALTTRLEQDFGSLPVTLFFEHQTLAEVGKYLNEAYPEEAARLLGAADEPTEPPAAPVVRPRFLAPARTTDRTAETPSTDVAIIGLAGRYPQAPDLATFWKNLLEGRNSVTEIPEDRWDYHAYYYDEDKTKSGRVYCRWGGFLDDVTRFDPLFFNISPREAAMMDPQERLFLECAYETIQDAGYVPDDLDGPSGRAGVYVGMMTADYPLFGVERQKDGLPVAVPGNFATVANRISFHLNFHGPSMAVDTMCSASLTAITLASEALRLGNCDVAIAGGVNLSLHPNKYLVLSNGKFASSNGRCESFGDEGDGYVPCEGVGAVLLKPLDRAVRDRDHIYGVIKGAAINHGGRTNGYSVPNPNAQGDVVSRALTQAGVDPRTVSYVEAHGTGTQLGDPIEIRGLSQAFGETTDRGFCAIGSVKSNIGHAEGAAGIVGLTKILLQMRHGKLVPSLHSDVLNPYIDFAETPFTVQRAIVDWERPVIGNREVPRIAALSSFGAGGSNAHLVVAEHRPPVPANEVRTDGVAIVLSAKSDEQLRQSAERLLAALRGDGHRDLASVAFTLQVGREAMAHRLGFVASGLDEAIRTLAGYLETDAGVIVGRAGRVDGTPDSDDLDSLVRHWVRGGAVDWRRLYAAAPGRVSLPTYPFANETYWLPAGTDRATGVSRLHPLVHANKSDVDGLRFSSVLDTENLTIGTMVEMARAAVGLSTSGAGGVLEFRDMV
jgi:acyl transferase domain-containing protein/acyl carrier protein